MKTTLLEFLKFIDTHKQHFSVSEYSHEDAIDAFLKDHTSQPQEEQTVKKLVIDNNTIEKMLRHFCGAADHEVSEFMAWYKASTLTFKQPQEGQTVALYKAVDLKTGEPVQYVGVHPLKWHDHPEQPDMGFVEYESTIPSVSEKEKEELKKKLNKN